MLRYQIFGCKTNKYYAEKWLQSKYLQDKSGIFVASCVVTDQAKRKLIHFVQKNAAALTDNEKIYLSGCAPIQNGELIGDFYEKFPELASFKNQIALLPEAPLEEIIPQEKETKKSLFTKKFLVIQTGCDNHCTFCLTVKARGKNTSRPLQDIIRDVCEFETLGGKEIVLTGTNLCAWGAPNTKKPQDSRFGELLNTILTQTTIPRIRISSIGPEYINDDIIEIFANPRIHRYLHFSIQSGSSRILKLMGRNYDRPYLDNLFQKIKQSMGSSPLPNFWADIIVGFPGETPEDFLQTADLVSRFHISRLHAFPFSDHSHSFGVPAGNFPDQVKNHIKMRSLRELLEKGKQETIAFDEKNKNAHLYALMERKDANSFLGWSENYLACDETNFIPDIPLQNIQRGMIVWGTYLGATAKNHKE